MRKLFILISFTLVAVQGCRHDKVMLPSNTTILHDNQDKLTQVIIYDGFTPPVASRLYAYTSLASYEAVRFIKPGTPSIAERLRGFPPAPEPAGGKEYNFVLAATRSFFNVVRKVKVFSVDSLTGYEEKIYKGFMNMLSEDTYRNSLEFGDTVAAYILRRAYKDGYLQSRGKAKYLGSKDKGKWRPTPPDYLDGIEWCWNTMLPFVLDSASQFRPAPPPGYSLDPKSFYFKYMKEVYDIGKSLTDEQKIIAKFWDDNPMVIEHSGHMMFANKKITPGGHWMGITAIASKMANSDEVTTAKAYTYTALALFEGFISCWDEKYRSSFIRPVSAINESVDKFWMPYLQTPPFPEYTSGHSVISSAAAEVLTGIYGDNFAFLDTADLRYIGMQRQFSSFRKAAAETSISRVYGGIHYRFTADTSMVQGRKVGKFILTKLGNI